MAKVKLESLHTLTLEDLDAKMYDIGWCECGCQISSDGETVTLCEYHKGMEAGIRLAVSSCYEIAAQPGALQLEHYTGTPSQDGKYRWRLVHKSNGKTMAQGEGYKDKRDRNHATNLLFPHLNPVEK